jgi:hypothetical protein
MHVRVCVDCGEEYRPDITTCADCGGQLEDRHDGTPGTSAVPAEAALEDDESPEADFTESVQHAEKATDLTKSADQLVESGIPFRLRPATGSGYRLLVTAKERDRALGVLGLLADGEGDPGEGPRACPACETRVEAGAVECPECGLTVGDEGDDETS